MAATAGDFQAETSMPAINPIREALTTARFCYMVEMVASQRTPEAALWDIASQLAPTPGLVAASITSYAGGSAGHDPIQIGAGVLARGLTPNIHLTCVNKDLPALRKALTDIQQLGIENVFAITGDYPKTGDPSSQPFFD